MTFPLVLLQSWLQVWVGVSKFYLYWKKDISLFCHLSTTEACHESLPYAVFDLSAFPTRFSHHASTSVMGKKLSATRWCLVLVGLFGTPLGGRHELR